MWTLRRAAPPRGVRDVEVEVDVEARWDSVGRRLHLLGRDRQDPLFPRELDLDLGVPGLVDPLLEEPTQAATAHVLESALQIAGLDDAARVPREVRMDAAPEERVAELRAKRVQDETALLVEVAVEEIERRVVVLAHDGPPVAAVSLGHVRVEIAPEAEGVFVATEVLLAPDVLEEGGEAFVEPALVPGAARDEIAEPLVRELVGDEIVGRDVDRGPLVEQDVLVHRRRGRVLHPTEDEVGHDDLRVPAPRVRHAGDLAEVRDHLRRSLERAAPVVLAAAGDQVRDGDVAGVDPDRVGQLRELSGDERHEVARVRLGHPVVEDDVAFDRASLDENAVRERVPPPWHARDDLRRHLRVGAVVARDPVARVLFLALRPHLARAIGVVLVGLEEVEAASRRRAVGHADARRRAPGIDRHEERAPVVLEHRGLPVDGDAIDLEADGVERQVLRRGVDAPDVERRRGADGVGGDVEREVERQVIDGEGAIALEVSGARWKDERPPGGGVLGGANRGAAAPRVEALLESHVDCETHTAKPAEGRGYFTVDASSARAPAAAEKGAEGEKTARTPGPPGEKSSRF